MKRLLHKIFSYTNTNRQWYHIIGWWEVRRIFYNVVLLATGAVSLLLFSLIVDGVFDFIPPFAFLLVPFLANLFYTAGWAVEIIYSFFQKNSRIGIRLLKSGLIFSVTVFFIPPVIFGLAGLIAGKKYSSPYSHFIKHQPNWNLLAGTYALDTTKDEFLNHQEKQLKPRIILNRDGTADMVNFPEFDFREHYQLTSGKAKWSISSWQSEKSLLITSGADTYSLKIMKDKSGYILYDLIGDPDNWAGEYYHKQK